MAQVISNVQIKVKTDDGWVDTGDEDPDVPPDPDPPDDTTWTEMRDDPSRSASTITTWYEDNTGHLSDGWTGTLWSVNDEPDEEVTISASWLTTHEGANVVDNGDGSWTVIGLEAKQINVRVSNLRLEHCKATRNATDFYNGLRVVDPSTGADSNVTNTGIVAYRCTFDGGAVALNHSGDVLVFSPDESLIEPDMLRFEYCQGYGYRAGFMTYGGVTCEYNYIHNLDYNLETGDPHNTSASIRARHTRLHRNFFADGTSSDVSLYADTDPYTEFEVTENFMMVDPVSAIEEVNFPMRSPNFWNILEPGYRRVFRGNFMERGQAGDLQYFTEVTENEFMVGGRPLFGGGTAPDNRETNVPCIVTGFSTGFDGYANPETFANTWHFTATDDSTLLFFHGLAQAGHTATPAVDPVDTSGADWALVTGCQTPVQALAGNLSQYGVSSSLWQVESGVGEEFRRLEIDPYSTANSGYQSMFVIEIPGVTGLSLAQARALSAVGSALGFGATTNTIMSGSLGASATPGNHVFFLVAYQHEDDATDDPTVPAGWTMLGNFRENKCSVAVFWRDDFSGTAVTINDLGVDCGAIVSTLVEFAA